MANKKKVAKNSPPSTLSSWRLKLHLTNKKRFFVAVAFLLLLLWVLGMYLFGSIYQIQHKKDSVVLGTSFSKGAAQELGMDWQANFTALLDDLQIRNFRLVSYWYDHEPEPKKYNFDDLDWQFDEVAKRGGKISLAVGLRQPRWPECHQPNWAKQLEATNKREWYVAISSYIQTVVERYQNHPALESWHLENEYFNRNFGECNDFSKNRLADERDLISRLDGTHPVIITLADQLGFPFTGPHPDIYATSLYRGNYVKFLGYFAYPIPSHFYSAKSFWVKVLHNKDMFIHELQLEPWGPRATKDLSIADQDYYMNTKRMETNIMFAQQTGMHTINLWGAEWWYWRKVKFSDPGPWNVVKQNVTQTVIE